MLTANRTVCLAKPFKHMPEKCRIDAGSVVLNTDPYTVLSRVEEVDIDDPSSLREFDGVGQQVPDDLLQSLRVAFNEPC